MELTCPFGATKNICTPEEMKSSSFPSPAAAAPVRRPGPRPAPAWPKDRIRWPAVGRGVYAGGWSPEFAIAKVPGDAAGRACSAAGGGGLGGAVGVVFWVGAGRVGYIRLRELCRGWLLGGSAGYRLGGKFIKRRTLCHPFVS